MSQAGVILIGAGQSSAWCAKTLRAYGYSEKITMIGSESYLPYERPPLSKDYIKGSITSAPLFLMTDEELVEKNIQFLPNETVQKIDPQARLVITNKASYPYSQLVIASGGTPFIPPIAGIQEDGVLVLRSIDDADEIKERVQRKQNAKVLIMGAGWIGLEVAATLQQMGVQVTVVEANKRICQRSVNASFSQILLQKHLASGLKVLLETHVTAIHRTQDRLFVNSNQGELGEFDAIIVGAGIKPNIDFLENTGIQCQYGVLVDEACRTNVDGIYASGDVAVRFDSRAGEYVRLESWQNAQDQGVAVAKSILGETITYHPYPTVWSEQYDWLIQIFGYQANDGVYVLRGEANSNKFIQFSINNNNQVVGFIAINPGRDLRVLKKMVEKQITVDLEQLTDLNLSLEQLFKNTQLEGA